MNDNKTLINGKTIEENTPVFAHEVIEHCDELNGLKTLLFTLYEERTNGNRFLNPEQACSEMLDAICFSAKAIDRISKELSKSTQLVGC